MPRTITLPDNVTFLGAPLSGHIYVAGPDTPYEDIAAGIAAAKAAGAVLGSAAVAYTSVITIGSFIAPGDILPLIVDGVTQSYEAIDDTSEYYDENSPSLGDEGYFCVLANEAAIDPAVIAGLLKEAINAYTGNDGKILAVQEEEWTEIISISCVSAATVSATASENIAVVNAGASAVVAKAALLIYTDDVTEPTSEELEEASDSNITIASFDSVMNDRVSPPVTLIAATAVAVDASLKADWLLNTNRTPVSVVVTSSAATTLAVSWKVIVDGEASKYYEGEEDKSVIATAQEFGLGETKTFAFPVANLSGYDAIEIEVANSVTDTTNVTLKCVAGVA